MKIATWNLNRCRPGESRRARHICDYMNQVDADVWVLTETYRRFDPGSKYTLVAHSADAPDREADQGECWVAVWSRVPAEPFTLTADRERVAAAKIGDSTILIGTVLPWSTDDRNPGVRGTKAYRARLAEQAADWKRLRQAEGYRLCVAGDFNQDLLTTGHYYQSAEARKALRETLADCGLIALTGGEHDPLAGRSDSASIDHICVGGMRAKGTPPSTAWPSPESPLGGMTDHYGVWADLDYA